MIEKIGVREFRDNLAKYIEKIDVREFRDNLAKYIEKIEPIAIVLQVCCNPNPQEISDKANRFTVRIVVGNYSGTGIIFKKEGNTYHVITTKHNFRPSPPCDVDERQNLSIATYDNKKHMFSVKNISCQESLDLATIKFDSNDRYEIAQFSPSIANNEQVYLFGYKACDPQKYTFLQMKEFTEGTVKNDRLPNAVSGYSIQYNNPSIRGMSGSPLLNNRGDVVAIHGASKLATTSHGIEVCQRLNSRLQGDGRGIPVEKFLNYVK